MADASALALSQILPGLTPDGAHVGAQGVLDAHAAYAPPPGHTTLAHAPHPQAAQRPHTTRGGCSTNLAMLRPDACVAAH